MSGRPPSREPDRTGDPAGSIPSAWGQACPRSVRLAPDGFLVPSGTLLLHAALAWARHRPGRTEFEFGDWFTWFLRPDGTIGQSFTHMFSASAVVAEARRAGFRTCRRQGAYFVAGEFDMA